MTKSSKLIATLGVVAGLGVAALPLGSVFASETQVSTDGDAQLYVEVQPAISITISGNNDNNAKAGATSTNAAVDNSSNPFTESATQKDPFTNAAIQNTKASSSYVSILPNQLKWGDGSTGDDGFGSTVTVYTNDVTGYTLNLKATSGTALTNTTGSGAETIPAATQGTDLAAGTAGWAYRLASTDGTAGVTIDDEMAIDATTGENIVSTIAKTTSGSASVIEYGVATAKDQAQGVYTTTVTYTATTNN